ncbi:MAG: hypothetical protein ABI039_06950, partial [Vicinamibacterales bacterium]
METGIIGCVIWLAASLTLIYRAPVAAVQPTYIDDPESYAVYASLLSMEWTVAQGKAKTLVFQQDSGGFMVISAVGFNAARTRAMVYMAHSCGSLCGGGTHHLL